LAVVVAGVSVFIKSVGDAESGLPYTYGKAQDGIYLFCAYTQEDGSLLLSGKNSNVPLDIDYRDSSNRETLLSEIEKNDVYLFYLDGFMNQIKSSRSTIKSTYDVDPLAFKEPDIKSVEIKPWPEVVHVQAWNSEYGYVVKADLEKAMCIGSTPAETERLMRERFIKAADVFKNTVRNEAGYEMNSSIEEIADVLQFLYESNGAELSFSEMSKDEQQAILLLLSNLSGEKAASMAALALLYAHESDDTYLPVYSNPVDPNSIVGEYCVNWMHGVPEMPL
jgi:hypothetical protein